MKKIIFLCLVLLLSFDDIYAKCSYSEISRMKKFAENVNLTYDYKQEDAQIKFYIKLVNLTPDMYLYDVVNDKNYYYQDTNDGEIIIESTLVKSGNYKIFSANENCYGTSLHTKYYNLPTYNIYYNNSLCEGLQNFSLCKKWVSRIYSTQEFERLINDYKNKLKNEIEEETPVTYKKTFLDVIVGVYIKYYYLMLPLIIIICLIMIIMEKKKQSFKL